MAGGSLPADIDICESPDRLQTEISATSTELAGGSPPAYVDICVIPDVLPITKSVNTVMSDKSMIMDTLDDVATRMEIAGGSPPAEIIISKGPDRLQTEISVTSTEMARGSPPAEIDICESPKVMGLDGLAPDDDPARRSSDVDSDACVIQNQIPTVVSVRTVVTEKWMDRFVLDLVEHPSVSRTSVMARTFGPAVSEEYSPVVFAGGGGGAVVEAYPLVVVESDTAQVSGLPLVEPDTAQVSVLPVAGGKFPAVVLGKVAFDVVGLGGGPPCLRVDSEETLLTLTDEQAQLAHAAPGVTPVDSSEKGAPVRELKWPSVLGEPLVDCLQEPMSGEKSLEYAIQATASVWMPFAEVAAGICCRRASWEVGFPQD